MPGRRTESYYLPRRLIALLLALSGWGVVSARAQCTGNALQDREHRVRAVRVEARFGRIPSALQDKLAKHRGEIYKPFTASPSAPAGEIDIVTGAAARAETSTRNEYINQVSDFLRASEQGLRDAAVGDHKFNEFSVRHYDACVTLIAPSECAATLTDDKGEPVSKCVDITVRVTAVYLNTGSISHNLLALLPSNKLLLYEQLPRPLLAFNPNLWFDQDREYGTAAAGSIKTDLLDVATIWRGARPNSGPTQLLLRLDGRRSLREPFYNLNTGLALINTKHVRLAETLGFEADFALNRQPLGEGVLFTNAVRLRSRAAFKITQGPISKLSLGAGYRRANQRYLDQAGLAIERATEAAFETHAIADANFGRTFLRGAIWFDAAAPSQSRSRYYRFAAQGTLAREFHLSQQACEIRAGQCLLSDRNPPAIGVELGFGAGRASDRTPAYARFYGGNTAGNFLYDSHDGAAMTALPGGPLLRSFGRHQATTRSRGGAANGGTAYWSFNLTTSLPLPGWSKPLIPNILLAPGSDCAACLAGSIKTLIKNQVTTSQNLHLSTLTREQLTEADRQALALADEDEATLSPADAARLAAAQQQRDRIKAELEPEVKKIWNGVRPMVGYITDHANIYAIKPIVMFDAARLYAPEVMSEHTRLALGGGLQLTVVVAKFEVGYLRTLNRAPGDQRGNFVVRMVFEKFF